MEPKRFEFQKYREFGDIIGDTFKFMIGNIKPFLTGFIVFVLPVFLLGALIMIPLTSQITSFLAEENTLSMAIFSVGSLMFALGTILGSLILYALVYAIVDAYQDYPEEELTVSILWSYMPNAIGKIFLVSLILFFGFSLIMFVLTLLPAMVSPAFAVLGAAISLPVIIYLMIRFIFTPYIYVREDLPIIDSFRKSAFLVQDNWWWTLLTVVVLSIISSMISYIFVLPASFYMGASSFLSPGAEDMLATPSRTAVILYGLSMIGSLFVNAYSVLGLVLYYYAQKEKKEGTGLMDRIEKIGDAHPMGFENEGEY